MKFKKGDFVKFKDEKEQASYENEYPMPYLVSKSEKRDIYSSGLDEGCWEEIVSVQDAKGEIFAEEEADNLCKL